MTKQMLEKISVDKTNHSYLLENQLQGSRFSVWKTTYFGKNSQNFKANWMMLLFAIPMIVVYFYITLVSGQNGIYTPFNSNFGIGYPVISNAEYTFSQLEYQTSMMSALMMVPCFMILFLGMAGLFNVTKYSTMNIDVKVMKEFFKGIKRRGNVFMTMGLLFGLSYLLLIFAINGFGIYGLALWIKIIAIIIAALILALVALLSLYVMTSASLYGLTLGELLKNAFIFTVGFPLQNLIFLIVAAIPVGALFLISSGMLLQVLVTVAIAMFGFTFISSVWTVYNHFVYTHAFTAIIEEEEQRLKKARAEEQRAESLSNNRKKKKGKR